MHSAILLVNNIILQISGLKITSLSCQGSVVKYNSIELKLNKLTVMKHINTFML